jgi:hypothetical protein
MTYTATPPSDWPTLLEAQADDRECGPHVRLTPAESAALVAEIARLQATADGRSP